MVLVPILDRAVCCPVHLIQMHSSRFFSWSSEIWNCHQGRGENAPKERGNWCFVSSGYYWVLWGHRRNIFCSLATRLCHRFCPDCIVHGNNIPWAEKRRGDGWLGQMTLNDIFVATTFGIFVQVSTWYDTGLVRYSYGHCTWHTSYPIFIHLCHWIYQTWTIPTEYLPKALRRTHIFNMLSTPYYRRLLLWDSFLLKTVHSAWALGVDFWISPWHAVSLAKQNETSRVNAK